MTEHLTILRAATHETELGDHDFCLSRSHYTDTDPTSNHMYKTKILSEILKERKAVRAHYISKIN